MITHMQMKNFKSWQDTGDVTIAPLTGFFGANSSGKSSLLQMLLLLKQTTESSDRNLVLKTGSLQEGYVNLGTVQEITHGDATDLSLSVGWTLPEPIMVPIPRARTRAPLSINQLLFSTEIAATQQNIHVKQFDYTSEHFTVGMKRVEQERYDLTVLIDGKKPQRPRARPRVQLAKPQKCYGFSDEALLYYQQTDYLSDLMLNFEQQFRRLYYLGPLRGYPERIYTWAGERPTDVGLKGELTIAALLAGKNERVYPGRGKQPKLEQRIAEWLVTMGLAAAFETRPLQKGGIQYEVRIRRHEKSHEVLLPDLGFGVSQVLPVLVLCYYAPPGSTIILEQPEIHLHPAVQSALADVFIDVIKHRKVQLILESHSEHLLRRLQLRIAQEQLLPADIALYFCDIADGISQIKQLNVDQFGNIRNWPKDFFGDIAGDLVNMMDHALSRQINAKVNANGNKDH